MKIKNVIGLTLLIILIYLILKPNIIETWDGTSGSAEVIEILESSGSELTSRVISLLERAGDNIQTMCPTEMDACIEGGGNCIAEFENLRDGVDVSSPSSELQNLLNCFMNNGGVDGLPLCPEIPNCNDIGFPLSINRAMPPASGWMSPSECGGSDDLNCCKDDECNQVTQTGISAPYLHEKPAGGWNLEQGCKCPEGFEFGRQATCNALQHQTCGHSFCRATQENINTALSENREVEDPGENTCLTQEEKTNLQGELDFIMAYQDLNLDMEVR